MVLMSEAAAVKKRTLLVFAYEFSPESMIFSHQFKIIMELSRSFEEVVLIVNSSRIDSRLPSNIKIYDLKWGQSPLALSIFRLYLYFLQTVITKKPNVIFSFMTETHSAMIGPIAKILGIKHVLWYAHVATPIRLKIAKLFVDRILTSTPDSIDFSSRKLIPIGQMIDDNDFPWLANRNYSRKENWIHVGRLDPSKNIDLLIETFLAFQSNNKKMILSLVGLSTPKFIHYENYLKKKYELAIENGLVNFLGRRTSDEISKLLQQSDLFIHAFEGSLDKSLIEATFSGVTVITKNQAFLREFGPLSSPFRNDPNYLHKEIENWLTLAPEYLRDVAEKRRLTASNSHSFSSWILRVENELFA